MGKILVTIVLTFFLNAHPVTLMSPRHYEIRLLGHIIEFAQTDQNPTTIQYSLSKKDEIWKKRMVAMLIANEAAYDYIQDIRGVPFGMWGVHYAILDSFSYYVQCDELLIEGLEKNNVTEEVGDTCRSLRATGDVKLRKAAQMLADYNKENGIDIYSLER